MQILWSITVTCLQDILVQKRCKSYGHNHFLIGFKAHSSGPWIHSLKYSWIYNILIWILIVWITTNSYISFLSLWQIQDKSNLGKRNLLDSQLKGACCHFREDVGIRATHSMIAGAYSIVCLHLNRTGDRNRIQSIAKL